MTNGEIIENEAIIHGIFSAEEIARFAAQGVPVPLHTYAVWKEMGYQVKKGEHAIVTTRLWKYKGKAAEAGQEEEPEDGHYFLTKAFLFSIGQVEKIKNVIEEGKDEKC